MMRTKRALPLEEWLHTYCDQYLRAPDGGYYLGDPMRPRPDGPPLHFTEVAGCPHVWTNGVWILDLGRTVIECFRGNTAAAHSEQLDLKRRLVADRLLREQRVERYHELVGDRALA